MSEYHEPFDALPVDVRNTHRAIKSLIEELEAVDWYHQRVAVCEDDELRAILAHNRDEEIEHAVMALEWLRRRMPKWDEELKTYLFTEGPITAIEEALEGGEATAPRDLGIGKIAGGK